MDTTQQLVLQKLSELRDALTQADAVNQQGWMKKLFHDLEDAHVRATSEAALALQAEESR